MKVRIFKELDEKRLEEKINKFLEDTKNIDVVDIKYSIHFDEDTWYNKCTYHSALIMYEHQLIMTVKEFTNGVNAAKLHGGRDDRS